MSGNDQVHIAKIQAATALVLELCDEEISTSTLKKTATDYLVNELKLPAPTGSAE
jgi:hypothetical protein